MIEIRDNNFSQNARRSHIDLDDLPFDVIGPQHRELRRGTAYVLTGWIFGVVGLLALLLIPGWILALSIGSIKLHVWILGFVVSVLAFASIFPLFRFCRRRIRLGRRMRTLRGLDVLAKDQRPPVLFLRSFDDDELIDPYAGVDSFKGWRRYEHRLSLALQPIGPVIAIGRPGESEPLLGAARLYVSDEEWKTALQP